MWRWHFWHNWLSLSTKVWKNWTLLKYYFFEYFWKKTHVNITNLTRLAVYKGKSDKIPPHLAFWVKLCSIWFVATLKNPHKKHIAQDWHFTIYIQLVKSAVWQGGGVINNFNFNFQFLVFLFWYNYLDLVLQNQTRVISLT